MADEVDINDGLNLDRDRTGDPLDREPPDGWERRLRAPDRTLDCIVGYGELCARLDRYVLGRYRAGGTEMVPTQLLRGPDGVGKRRFVDALAGELEADVVRVGAPDGGSERPFGRPYRVGDRLAVAEHATETRLTPCLLHVAALDALDGPEPPVSVDGLVDRLSALSDAGVLVVGTARSTVPDALEAWFDTHTSVPLPDPADREAILRAALRDRSAPVAEIDWRRIRELSKGYARRDLEIVANDAARTALQGAVAADDTQPIRQVHIEAALEETTPTAERGGDA